MTGCLSLSVCSFSKTYFLWSPSSFFLLVLQVFLFFSPLNEVLLVVFGLICLCSPIETVEAICSWSQVLLCLDWSSLGWTLINLLLVSPLFFPFPSFPITPHLSRFLSHTVVLVRPDHKVAVGDIVKVTNGQHLPADMVIVSSRSDSLYECVWAPVCLLMSVLLCVIIVYITAF